MPNRTGGVHPPRRKGGQGYRVNKKGQRIGGAGHRLGGQGKRLAAPRAPRAPAAPDAPDSHKDRFGPINLNPPNNPKVTQPNKPGSASVTFDKNNMPVISGSSYSPANGADPRDTDPNYWKNFYLIQGQANTAYAGALAAQNTADADYGQFVSDTKEARETNRNKFARSLIGTGLLRSGYHNAEQVHADTDRDTTLTRAEGGKLIDDATRSGERSGILSDFANQEYGLYTDAVDYATDQQLTASEEGDPLAPGKRSRKSLNGQIAGLKKQYAKANNKKAKQRIHAKIKKIRAKKNSLYGKGR